MLSKKQQKWIEEKRGQGELSNYKPWIKISDISSSGCSHRIFGHKIRQDGLKQAHNSIFSLPSIEYGD